MDSLAREQQRSNVLSWRALERNGILQDRIGKYKNLPHGRIWMDGRGDNAVRRSTATHAYDYIYTASYDYWRNIRELAISSHHDPKTFSNYLDDRIFGPYPF